MSDSRRRSKQTLLLILVFGGTVALLVANSRQSRARPETQVTDLLAESFGLTAAQQSAVALVAVNGKGRCTGVLIERRLVLTAKHCLRDAKEVSVQFSNGRETSRTEVRVSRVDRHPRMDAVLLGLTVIRDVHLPIVIGASVRPDKGTQVLVAGYGAAGGLRENHGPRFLSGVVREVKSELIVDYEGAPGPCLGDSGGPLFLASRDGSLSLVGILRGGSLGCRGPDRFVMVDRLLPWIRERVAASQKEE